jgi:hypothetical protein
LFDAKSGAENPAEEMFRVKKGSDCGFPYCYFDNDKKQKLLNPEYGGDRKKVGPCDGKEKSIYSFRGILRPMLYYFIPVQSFLKNTVTERSLLFMDHGTARPNHRRDILWYLLPFKNGLPSGAWEVFANGFAGANVNKAKYRPCGLAQAPDGSFLYRKITMARYGKLIIPLNNS